MDWLWVDGPGLELKNSLWARISTSGDRSAREERVVLGGSYVDDQQIERQTQQTTIHPKVPLQLAPHKVTVTL